MNEPDLTRYVGTHLVTCKHKRLLCICMVGKLSPKEYAYQTGMIHRGYGWEPKPKGGYSIAEFQAYTAGFNHHEDSK